jgi:hypothetical protein
MTNAKISKRRRIDIDESIARGGSTARHRPGRAGRGARQLLQPLSTHSPSLYPAGC